VFLGHVLSQLLADYLALFYIAFVKPHTAWDPCIFGTDGVTPDCMLELEAQVSSIVITKATTEQFMEICVPAISVFITSLFQAISRRSFRADANEMIGLVRRKVILDEDKKIVLEAKLPAYESTYSDYGELVIQYGYMMLFGLCFPLSALIHFLNNVVETRTDAFKVFALSQRADASDGGDIGAWLPILKFMSSVSVYVNAGLIVFTGNTFKGILPDTLASKMIAYLVLEKLFMAGQAIIEYTVNETPGRAIRILQRQQYIMARSFDVGWKPYFRSNVEQEIDEDIEGVALPIPHTPTKVASAFRK
jgi:hypothetical protein